jgi:UDP-N-acetylglucosamine 1-carboxyvinyltransferase
MEKIIVKGGCRLQGAIRISGAKNAALPIMAASLLAQDGRTRLLNVPMVSDVLTLKEILEKLDVSILLSETCALIDVSSLGDHVVPLAESKRMRASVFLAGPLLARFGQVMITEPGGCVIGNRPIDMHLEGFKALGARVHRVDSEYIKIEAPVLRGSRIQLRFPSVGVTENLIMASCLAKGNTVIENAAREPEVVDLANFLTNMGAKIDGCGSSVVRIEGVDELVSTEYSIIPDRIETGTYAVAAALTHGDVLLKNTYLSFLGNVVSKLQEVGVEIQQSDEGIQVTSRDRFQPTKVVTSVYPGFPTDMQSIITPLLSLADGKSSIRETIFERRFNHVPELRKMGADLEVSGDTLFVRGVKEMRGTKVEAFDLRSGASLLLAGLAAKGETEITGVDKIYRGYEDPLMKLKKLGAEVYCINQ